jgi:dephospho-CoA kinase
MRTPIIIGVTGGIGAGKSTVVEAFARRGAVAFSADTAVHELYALPQVIDAVRARWGDGVFTPTGEVDRGAIASIVFTDDAERSWLEGLLHPLVGVAWQHFVDEQAALPQPPEFVVAEVPLLYEAGLEERYDVIVAITAPHDVRMERIAARGDGRSLPAERSAAQMRQRDKAARADFSYVNTGSLSDLERFADDLLDELRVAD